MELSPTGKVVLGMVALGRQTGYDIKQFADRTARHFMAVSYGQIYPELKRLEADGLLTASADPTGGRARTVYELTSVGRAALRGWLASDAEPLFELRDEGMLKLFLSDSLPERRIQNVRAMRLRNEGKLALLRALDPEASAGSHYGPYLTLQLGISFLENMIAWCEQTERRLSDEAVEVPTAEIPG